MKVLCSILFMILIFSCNNSSKNESSLTPLVNDRIKNKSTADQSSTYSENSSDSTLKSTGEIVLQGSSPQPTPDWDKKIVKTASVKLEVNNFKSYGTSLHNLVKQYGGYIGNEQQESSENLLANGIDIKVPVANFEALLNEVTDKDVKVTERTINTEDATGDIVDTKSRLLAKEEMRLKYMEFLKGAKNMSEVLQVQGEINRLQEEIEAAGTRVNYLSHQAALSTIHLYYFQTLIPTGDNKAPGFFDRTLEAVKDGGKFIANLFIAMLTIWPLWLIFLGGIFVWKKKQSAIKAKA